MPPAAARIRRRTASVSRASPDALLDELPGFSGRQRFEPEVHGPAGALFEEFEASQTYHEDPSVTGQERQLLHQVEKGVLAPLDVVEDSNRTGDAAAIASITLRKRPGDLVGRGCGGTAEQQVDGGRRAGFEPQLGAYGAPDASASMTGQYVMPSP